MSTTQWEADTLSTTATVSGTLSMVGSLAIMASYFSRPRADRKELGIKMVFIESVLDFGASFFFALGPVFIPSEGWDDNDNPSSVCVFQGFMIQFEVIAVIWNAVIAVNFYYLVVRTLSTLHPHLILYPSRFLPPHPLR